MYYYFSRWKEDGTLEEIHENLRDECRKQQGKQPSPSVGLIDRQSVKTARSGGESRGVDGGKKRKGRKRHIITDNGGLLLTVEIHAANEHDGRAGFSVIKSLRGRFDSMKKIYADGAYRGELEENVKNDFGWNMEITLRSDKSVGFQPLPKRWMVYLPVRTRRCLTHVGKDGQDLISLRHDGRGFLLPARFLSAAKPFSTAF